MAASFNFNNNNQPTPVLNLGTNKIVLIQMDNPVVVNKASIRHSDKGNVFIIEGDKYQELLDTIYMPNVDEDLTKAFVISRYKDNHHIDLDVLSDEAYDFIYDSLPADVGIQQVLDSLYEELFYWHEDNCEDVLDRLGIEHDHLEIQEKEDLADELLENCNLEDYCKMLIDGEKVFVYKWLE